MNLCLVIVPHQRLGEQLVPSTAKDHGGLVDIGVPLIRDCVDYAGTALGVAGNADILQVDSAVEYVLFTIFLISIQNH